MTQRPQQLLFALLLLVCSSCVIRFDVSPSASKGFTLAEHDLEDGRHVEYRIQPNESGEAAIHRVETSTVHSAWLGVSPRSITSELADELGVRPWRGVWLQGVTRGSAAEDAGLRRGDILLSLAYEDLLSSEQCIEVIQSSLFPGEPTPVTFLRREGDGAWLEQTVEVEPRSKAVDETSSARIPLESESWLREQTGMQVATVPANLSEEIWDRNATTALITSVVTGSEAYLQGLRGGDVIRTCNGQPVAKAADLEAAIQGGLQNLNLEVQGPLGPHQASIGTDEQIHARSDVHIPLLYRKQASISRKSTSFLDFIFQFGFNSSRTYLESSTREPRERSFLSILPLGMFEFERTPDSAETTIFWFIEWSSRR